MRFNRYSFGRLAPVLAVTVLLAAGTACGSQAEDAAAVTPVTEATGPTGSGAEDEAGSAPAALVDVCTQVTDAEIAEILDEQVTRDDVPGGGCSFSSDDPRDPTISLNTSAFDESAGGFEGATFGVSAMLQGDGGELLTDVGEEAYVKTGTTGGDNQQGGGVVHLGAAVVQVTLIQGTGVPAAQVRGLVVDTLRLAASKY